MLRLFYMNAILLVKKIITRKLWYNGIKANIKAYLKTNY